MKKRIKNYIDMTDDLLNAHARDTDWECVMKEHLTQMGFFMHERLIHLIVTALFAILTFMVLLSLLSDFSPALAILFVALMVLLVPYILHYYFLENSVQYMYEQYDRMREYALRKV